MITTTQIYDWIAAVTGLGTQKIIRANQSGPRPAAPFATFQIVTIEAADYSDEVGTADGYDIDYADTRKYMVSVDVNTYGTTALSNMQKLVQSNRRPDIRSILTSETTLFGTESIQDLTGLDDTEFLPRYQAEFRFGTYNVITNNVSDYVWDDYDIDGELEGETVEIKP